MKTRECKCTLGGKFQICSGSHNRLPDTYHNDCINTLADGTRCDHDPACHEEVEVSTSKSEPTYETRLRDELILAMLPAVYADAMKDAREGSGLFETDQWRTGLVLDAIYLADAAMQARKQGGE